MPIVAPGAETVTSAAPSSGRRNVGNQSAGKKKSQLVLPSIRNRAAKDKHRRLSGCIEGDDEDEEGSEGDDQRESLDCSGTMTTGSSTRPQPRPLELPPISQQRDTGVKDVGGHPTKKQRTVEKSGTAPVPSVSFGSTALP